MLHPATPEQCGLKGGLGKYIAIETEQDLAKPLHVRHPATPGQSGVKWRLQFAKSVQKNTNTNINISINIKINIIMNININVAKM